MDTDDEQRSQLVDDSHFDDNSRFDDSHDDGSVLGVFSRLKYDPPMDEDTYREILDNKGKASLLNLEEQDEFTEEQFRLRQDLAFGKVRWYGNYAQDLWCYLRNNNPIFSICYSHPLHPIERWERYYIYATIIIFKMSLAVLVTRAAKCMDDGVLTCSDAHPHIENATAAGEIEEVSHWHICCWCSWLGIRFAMQHLGTQWGGRAYLLVIGALYAITTFQFAACSCASRYHSTKKRHFIEHIGHAVVAIITVVVLVIAYHPFRYCLYSGTLDSAFVTFVIAQSISWLGATLCVPGLTCFTILNWKEQSKEWDRIRWNVNWQEYQKHAQGDSCEYQPQSTMHLENEQLSDQDADDGCIQGKGCFRPAGLCEP